MSFVSDFVQDLTGANVGDAARYAAYDQEQALDSAIAETRRSSDQGLGYLEPYAQLGMRGIEESSFLANPEEQYDFLVNNPLFQASLNNANRATDASAAAGGRLSAGDTLMQLSSNFLGTATPLINAQRQDIGNLLNLGTGIAQSQANTAINQGSNVAGFLTDIGNAQSAGVMGDANASNAAANNILKIGAQIAGMV